MKTPRYTHLCCLLTAASVVSFCCSCTTEKELRASIDGSRQVYKGGMYTEDSPTSEDVGWNIGLIILTSPGGTLPKKQSYRAPKGPDAGKLYASNSFVPTVPAESSGYSFMDHVRLEYGLELINKRSKDGGSKVNLIYLEVPIQALYAHDLGNGTILGGLGPYLAYGVAGKIKFPGDKVKSFSKDDGFKRPDAGLMVSAGYKMRDSFSFRLAYEYGMVNIGRNLGDAKVQNRTFSLNVGYPIDKLLGKMTQK
jgi:hypothetical protein